jgi:putative membrane protein
VPLTLRDLPTLNAVLNATSAVLLGGGYAAIRRKRKDVHRRFMIAACCSSSLFLVSYLVYHFQVGSVRFTGQGPIRIVYLAVLASHTILAVGIVPLVLVTLSRALHERFPAHRQLARVTLPLWAYVSVTGVVIYWMLYRL